MVRIAHDLQVEGLISAATSINRIEPDKLNELLHPVFNKKDLKTAKMISQGLPASWSSNWSDRVLRRRCRRLGRCRKTGDPGTDGDFSGGYFRYEFR